MGCDTGAVKRSFVPGPERKKSPDLSGAEVTGPGIEVGGC
jgi:hypothetical protein